MMYIIYICRGHQMWHFFFINVACSVLVARLTSHLLFFASFAQLLQDELFRFRICAYRGKVSAYPV
jgi:hypothetical protein